MTALRRCVLAFLLLKLGVLITNMRRFPVLGATPLPPVGTQQSETQRVSLLVPVRNEAGRLAAFLPAVLGQDAEVIVLDDRSEDDSYAVAAGLIGTGRGQLVAGAPIPAGWVGKSWACHQLAERAQGDVLVFCDADVHLAPDAVSRVLEQMRTQQADVFSVFPRQLTGTLGEHLVTPLIDDVLLCLLPFALLSIDQPGAATANGSLLAFTQAAYDRLGGFAAVRGEIVEDVALARRARKASLTLGLALGGGQVQTRMYEDYRGVVRGLGRGLLPVAGGSRPLLVAGLGWHLVAYTLPVVLALRDRAWLVPIVLAVTERALVELKTGRSRLWQAPLITLSPLAATPVVAQALRRRQTWKGRVYA